MLKSILKNPKLPEWKEADEIVRHVWLGTITENESARRRNITQVICISKEPRADLQREGFVKAPDLDSTTFGLESDTEGNLLPILTAVCDAINRTLWEGEGVLVWDVGGGVAALAAYIVKKYEICLPEAMMVITRARLKREKPTLLPSRRIIDTLNNDRYQAQLEMWQACKYDMHEWVVENPQEPREEWIIKKAGECLEEERDGVRDAQSRSWRQIAEGPHRISTINEVKEEARRLSKVSE